MLAVFFEKYWKITKLSKDLISCHQQLLFGLKLLLNLTHFHPVVFALLNQLLDFLLIIFIFIHFYTPWIQTPTCLLSLQSKRTHHFFCTGKEVACWEKNQDKSTPCSRVKGDGTCNLQVSDRIKHWWWSLLPLDAWSTYSNWRWAFPFPVCFGFSTQSFNRHQ